jgi:hypothetical protein
VQAKDRSKREHSREMYQGAPFGKFSYDRARFKRNLILALNSIKHPTEKIVFDVGCGKGYWFSLFIAAGGVILLSVYNVWNPYLFFVHRRTWILRAVYWRWSRKVYYLAWGMAAPIAQVLSLIILRKFLKNDELRTLLMDQVFTPYAKLFSERTLKNLPQGKNVEFVSGGASYLWINAFCKMCKTFECENYTGGQLSFTWFGRTGFDKLSSVRMCSTLRLTV